MWEGLVRDPLGRNTLRKFIMLFTTALVASFAYILVTAPTTYAAPATWDNETIEYNGDSYEGPTTATADDPSQLQQGVTYFTSIDSSDGEGKLIYFERGADTSQATEAKYRTGEYSVGSGQFSNLSPPQIIEVDNSGYNSTNDTTVSDCNVDGIGWLVCPVSYYVADGIDSLYGVISSFLTVTAFTLGDSSLYSIWKTTRNIANITFIVGFLILIYAQLTGGFASNYTIKRVLPRVVIAAILVNTSYWICAVAVDISNILGASVYAFFVEANDNLGAANGSAVNNIGWAEVAGITLGGGSAAALGLVAASGGTLAGGAFLLVAALVPAVFAVFVTIAILAARQALIIVFVILSPLAFAAYLLPNTEDWFQRWKKLFLSILVMFPAFAVLFGGSQLAGKIIIQNADSIFVVILGLLVQFVPLFITPFLIRLSTGVLGTIAGLANDRSKGGFDKVRNWADDNRRLHQARGVASDKKFGTRAIARRMNRGKLHRDRMTKAYGSMADARYSNHRKGQQAYMAEKSAGTEKANADAKNEQSWQRRVSGDEQLTRRNITGRKVEDTRYQDYRSMMHETHEAQGSAKIIEDRIHDEGERHFRESIANAAPGTYQARLRGMQVQSAVDSGLSEDAKKLVDSQGSLALKQTIEGSDALKRQVNLTYSNEQEADKYNTIVQEAAKASWNKRSISDDSLQRLRMRSELVSQNAKEAETQYTSFIESANAVGNKRDDDGTLLVKGLSEPNASLASSLKKASEKIAVNEQEANSAKIVERRALAKALETNDALRTRAAGVDTKDGETRVLAAARAAATKDVMENADNLQNTMPYDQQSNLRYLEENFDDATMVQKIAHARLLAKSGPGVKRLRQMLTRWTADKDPLNDDVMMLKEILGADNTFRSASRDFEVWANNEAKDDSGTLYGNFDEVAQNPGVWRSIKANRFAAMSEPAQRHALTLLQSQDNGIELVQQFAERMLFDPSIQSSVKGPPLDMLKNAISSQSF